MNKIIGMGLALFAVLILIKIWKSWIYPLIIEHTTKEIEKNPKWITPKLRETYYGFSNVDIIVAENSLGMLPRFHIHRITDEEKTEERFEVLIPSNVSVKDVDDLATLILQAKLHIYYKLDYFDKSADWLSILLYLLDGGDIRVTQRPTSK